MRKWQNILILGWNSCLAQIRALCWKSLKSGTPSVKMAKHWSWREIAVLYKPLHFAENRYKVVRLVRKRQNMLISGWKRWFVQTRSLCWKSLKSGTLSAEMAKHSDLGMKQLFCANSCALLKIAKKWYAQCENGKTLILGRNRCFVQTPALCWKSL